MTVKEYIEIALSEANRRLPAESQAVVVLNRLTKDKFYRKQGRYREIAFQVLDKSGKKWVKGIMVDESTMIEQEAENMGRHLYDAFKGALGIVEE